MIHKKKENGETYATATTKEEFHEALNRGLAVELTRELGRNRPGSMPAATPCGKDCSLGSTPPTAGMASRSLRPCRSNSIPTSRPISPPRN